MISIPHTPNPNASSLSTREQDQLTTAANPPPASSAPQSQQSQQEYHYPRLTIHYCTQCKWMLRAAYFAQELLSTFSTQLGEVALVPATGGRFTVTVYHRSGGSATPAATDEESGGPVTVTVTETVLWDRKRDGGFPEVKVLKSLVRNVVDPGRDLGHTDRALNKAAEKKEVEGNEPQENVMQYNSEHTPCLRQIERLSTPRL
ncbi:SelT/SelW/SelH family protein [Aspergillus saccharolyticus JOP 1030-1]|uniref:Selenoprotein domain protein n=1 Tax=Aspergillus saccharolyticus JOP 1030-1 TaxID=1450539 RepID=A0A318ZTT0_9EURO|nr:hypothetical protein BP01DRAFT_388178 [Aspergillus saccharolyticus JOP 1030-1]PYH50055.1 hypothetical protein BP01DRAFT_388178 [Aspergillus saccharolyticus JOP 1030-1]